MYAELEQKVCKQCGKPKPLSEFRFRTRKGRSKGTYESYCKKCEYDNNKIWAAANKEKRKDSEFERNLKRKFNMTRKDYDAILLAQGNKCAICPKPRSLSGKALAVDHCHTTLAIRGLLCNECNTAIGLFTESIEILQSAIAYLTKFKKLG